MKEIGHFFDKFKSVAIKEVQKIDFIVDIINKETGLGIGPSDISFSRGNLQIKASPAHKSQIFIKKEKLIKEISKKYNILDIK